MELIFIILIGALLIICVLLKSKIRALENEFNNTRIINFNSLRTNFEAINSQAGYIQKRLDKLEAIHKEEVKHCDHWFDFFTGECFRCGKNVSECYKEKQNEKKDF